MSDQLNTCVKSSAHRPIKAVVVALIFKLAPKSTAQEEVKIPQSCTILLSLAGPFHLVFAAISDASGVSFNSGGYSL